MIREIHSNRLFIGNAVDARDLRLLYDNRIAAVVDLAANEPPAQLARDMIYCRIPIIDGDGNPSEIIETAIHCVISLGRKKGDIHFSLDTRPSSPEVGNLHYFRM